jgi:hypothetical protein
MVHGHGTGFGTAVLAAIAIAFKDILSSGRYASSGNAHIVLETNDTGYGKTPVYRIELHTLICLNYLSLSEEGDDKCLFYACDTERFVVLVENENLP